MLKVKWISGFILITVTWIAASLVAQESLLIEDFEAASFGQWTAEGDAFGSGPAREGSEHAHSMVGKLGAGFATSTNRSHEFGTGSLTSPPFTIERDHIHFLLGSHEIFWLTNPHEFMKVRIQLLVGNKVVRTTRPARFHAMFWEGWNVAEFKGMQAQIRIVDKDRRSGSHIDVDHIIQSNLPLDRAPLKRRLKLNKPLLNLPVKEGNARYYIEIFVDDEKVRDMDVELAVGEDIDYWVFCDLSPWLGKDIIIQSQGPATLTADALERLRQEDHIIGSEDLYREALRPQFHFSTKRGWINDPNGLVYYDGEYHLYYQLNPYNWDHSRDDVNKHWGHAVSSDLVHWQELPAAVHPDHLGSIYSGSAVVDENNTSGFQSGDEKVIVALFTSAGGRTPWSREELFTQSIAYSNDRGRTFSKYEGNPVQENIEYINRDPKAIWYEPDQQWIIVLHFDERAMAFFTSKDLKSWHYESELESAWLHDCPELFQLAVDGDIDQKKWILYGGAGYYLIGDFDGKRFQPESKETRFNFGNCFYASQTFNNIPEEDGRRLQIAWGLVNMPDMPFNQQMLFPVELTLQRTDEGLRMFANPVAEIANIQGRRHSWKDIAIAGNEKILAGIQSELLDIEAEITVGDGKSVGFAIGDMEVAFDAVANLLSCGNSSAALKAENGRVRLRLLIDRTTIEIFANNGRVYMPIRSVHGVGRRSLSLFSRGGTARLHSLEVRELASIWK